MTIHEFEAPLTFSEQTVLPEWVDFNGHMNVAFYMVAFDRCLDDMYNRLGVGPEHIGESGCSVFTLEVHINYLREVVEGDPLRVTGRLLDYDAKRIHAGFEMFHGTDGHMVAAMEQLGIHVNMEKRRPAELAPDSLELLAQMAAAHRELPASRYVGRVVGIPGN